MQYSSYVLCIIIYTAVASYLLVNCTMHIARYYYGCKGQFKIVLVYDQMYSIAIH